MRPLKLTMRAFGPYAGETTIDFDKLDGRHLFLICGPTGAGKTTILDAMCYALYGKTSGDRTGSHMRSDYATSAQKTEVIFDFSIGGKTYRAIRSPEQYIDKKRGKGQTKAAMQASLAELEDGKEVRTIRTGVEEAAGKLIGLNASQFCQVILLPQGDFRKLLVAKADEREAILKQLFKTQRFSDFQNELRLSLNDLLKKKAAETTELAATLSMAAAADEEDLKKQQEENDRFLEEKKKEREMEDAAYRDFRKTYQQAAVLFTHFETLEKAEGRLKQLLAMEKDMKEAEESLRSIRAARELSGYFDSLEKIGTDGSLVKKDMERWEKEQKKWAAAIEMLAQKGTELEKKKGDMDKNRQKVAEMTQWMPKAKAYGATLREVNRLTEKVEEATKEVQKLNAKAEADRKIKEAAEAEAEALRRDYIFGQAAILASQLRDGEPCPVCGSVHHPRPAVSDRNLPTEEEVKKAQERAAKAAETWNDSTQLAQQYQVSAYVSAISEQGYAQAKMRTLEDVPEEFRKPIALREAIHRLTEEIRNWEKETEETAAAREKAVSAYAAAEAGFKAARAQREKLAKDYTYWQQALLEKGKAAGFSSLAECRSWFERRGEEEKLARSIETYRRERQGAEKVAEDEKDFLKGSEKPDMARLGEEERNHQVHMRNLVKLLSDGENRKKLLEDTGARVKEINRRHEKTLKDTSLVSGLYNLTRGEKSRITLERYVLGALLDEVAKAANLRLLDMSHHRYSLHRMAGDSTDGRGGLTLEVSDSYTGRSRPANTLSGGETFLASLSLALGLADVVQAKQGGVRLDTMFIDEGFGTLDPEALNSAMNTLIDLQNTGRLVGIISHVPELEERIDARLKVTPAEKGSKAEFEILE